MDDCPFAMEGIWCDRGHAKVSFRDCGVVCFRDCGCSRACFVYDGGMYEAPLRQRYLLDLVLPPFLGRLVRLLLGFLILLLLEGLSHG